jgi:ATP-dependent RNA helicase RhlE
LSRVSFGQLGVSADIVKALAAREITTPFPIQALAVPEALAGRDVLAKSPTGSGKTLAFGLPLVERTAGVSEYPAALVLVPTRELAQQVAQELRVLGGVRGLRVAAVFGGAPVASQSRQARDAHLLVATPGRLQDLLDRGLVSVDAVRTLVLDEADRMLDMGFKPQVERIIRRLPRDRQTMLFSATLDGDVGELARTYTHDPVRLEASLPSHGEEGLVEHSFVGVTADGKLDALITELESERGLALVFVRTKRGADRLAHKLSRRDVATAVLHGDMPQAARDRALSRFRQGHVRTLIATDVAARGLDLDDITHVINFDPPADDNSYIHRVGRTGRAGRSGRGITFVLPEQEADMSRVAMRLGHVEQFRRQGLSVARPRKVYTSRRGRRSRW